MFDSLRRLLNSFGDKTPSSFSLGLSEKPDWHVSLHDSFNLRPAIETIMAAENWILDRIPEDQKLVILFGEFHEKFLHHIIQQGVLVSHIQQRKRHPNLSFSFGVELPHDEYAKVTIEEDPDGTLAWAGLKNHFQKALNATHYAMAGVHDYCLQQGISVGFNDIAMVEKDGQLYIDETHPDARAIVEQAISGSLAIKRPIPRISDSNHEDNGVGLHLSNISMAQKIMSHLERTGSRIYLQSCGASHVFGSASSGAFYQRSLSALLVAQGVQVLPVLLSSNRYEIHHAREKHMMSQAVTVESVYEGTIQTELPEQARQGYRALIYNAAQQSDFDFTAG